MGFTKEYRAEFFDRDYPFKEAYRRAFQYARPYRARIILGLICGLLNAGALIPFYQILQPAVATASGGEVVKAEVVKAEVSDVKAPKKTKLEKEMQKAAKLPSWYPKIESAAAKVGIRFTDDSGNMKGAMLFLVLVCIPLITLFRLGLGFLNTYCLNWSATRAVADLRCAILDHTERQSLEFFGRVDMGQIMMRVNGDPGQLQLILTAILTELSLAPFEIGISVFFVIWFAVKNQMLSTLLILAVGAPCFLLPIVALGKKMRKWSKKTLERGSVVGSKIHESLTGIRTIKAFHTEEYEDRATRNVNDYQLKTMMRALRVGLLVGPTIETVGIIMIGAFVVWCFLFEIPLSNIIPMLAPLMMIYKPIKEFSKLQVHIQTSLAALSRIFSLMDLDMSIPEREDALRKASFDDKIVFKDVTFKYATAENPAVKDASFEIKKGSFVAVVGGTGSGKSTLSALLSRFYDPLKGSITIDGIDLKDLKLSDLRHLIGTVMQESMLFNDTIEANIAYGNGKVSHDEIESAAKLANAHDFIVSQPEGYARLCGEKGFALSGGERQRVSIARALLKNPPILILDEATSALDTVTEHLVQEAIDKLMANRTTFAIAHRLSTIRKADMILVLNEGEIVERGTHEELFAKNGVYRKLCDMQNLKQ